MLLVISLTDKVLIVLAVLGVISAIICVGSLLYLSSIPFEYPSVSYSDVLMNETFKGTWNTSSEKCLFWYGEYANNNLAIPREILRSCFINAFNTDI